MPTFPLKAEMPTQSDRPGSYNFTIYVRHEGRGHIVPMSEPDADQMPTTGMHFSCPCGCGAISYLAFTSRPAFLKGGGPEWEWNGDRDRPTLSPSVLQSGLPCKWHGFLRDGYWVLA